ncbi:glycosyltransferase [Desulforhabdus sp. TSK]|uniref:glycosyltransferase n=1 Tax=Desulforhabdus sp. TSK TaxID=2925014 RepID=UPI0034D563A1
MTGFGRGALFPPGSIFYGVFHIHRRQTADGGPAPAVSSPLPLWSAESQWDTCRSFHRHTLRGQRGGPHAAAAGATSVVTDVGGPQENLIQGKTGWIIPAYDLSAFVQAIRTLVSDKVRLKAMSLAARSYMKKRSFETSFDESWKFQWGESQKESQDEPCTFARAS